MDWLKISDSDLQSLVLDSLLYDSNEQAIVRRLSMYKYFEDFYKTRIAIQKQVTIPVSVLCEINCK